MSGMRASRSTSGYGRPLGDAVPEGVHGRHAVASGVGSIRQPRSHSSRMRRLVALSSTISTGSPRSGTAAGGDRLRRVRLTAEAGREGEGAAPARLALHGDRAAHQGRPAGPRWSGPGRCRRTCAGRGVLLLERPEDLLLLVGRDANAGVRHREAQADLSPPARSRRRFPRAPPPRRSR